MENNNEEMMKMIADMNAKIDRLSKENAEMKGLTDGRAGKKLKEIQERVGDVRMIDDRVVIGYVNKGSDRRPREIYTKADPQNPTVQVNFIDVILERIGDDKENKVLSLKHEDFLEESERVSCKIVKTKKNEWVVNQGTTRKREVDGYALIEQDFVVDLEVKGTDYEFTMELPVEFGSREVVIKEKFLNI